MSLHDFDESYFPAWDEGDPEHFLSQLHAIKHMGLLSNDTDMIYGYYAYHEKFEKYEQLTLSQKTDFEEYCNFIRKSYDQNPFKLYPFQRIIQEEDENPAVYFSRVKAHYFRSRDCPIPSDQRIPEISKSDISHDYIQGLRCPKTRKYIQQNCTQYENLVPLTISFAQSLADNAESNRVSDKDKVRPEQEATHHSGPSSSSHRRSSSRQRRRLTRSSSKRRNRYHQSRSHRK